MSKDFKLNDKTLLDVGCASGYFVKAISPYVKNAYGLEIRKEDVDFARKKGLDVRKDLSDYPVNFFDIITIFHTLEHVKDPLSFLSNLKPYLKDKGKIYISVPNLNDIMLSVYKLPEFADWWYEEPHLYYFDYVSLTILCSNAGFTGITHTQQRVNILNHMHWLYAKEQQKEEEERMSIPVLSKNNTTNNGKSINTFIQRIDIDYREYLESNMIADNLVFVGVKKYECKNSGYSE